MDRFSVGAAQPIGKKSPGSGWRKRNKGRRGRVQGGTALSHIAQRRGGISRYLGRRRGSLLRLVAGLSHNLLRNPRALEQGTERRLQENLERHGAVPCQ